MSTSPLVVITFTLSIIHAVSSVNITESIELLTDELNALFCDGLSVGDAKCRDDSYGIQDYVDSLSNYFDDDLEDASTISQQIIAKLNDKLDSRASFLTAMASKIQSTCSQYSKSDWSASENVPDFTDLYFSGNTDRSAKLPSDIQYNAVYGNDVSLSQPTYKIPNNVGFDDKNVQKDAQLSYLLDETMLDLHGANCVDSDGNEEFCAMYFGTVNGVFRQYPGTESKRGSNNKYSSYDPRFRSWYVSAATGRKDVVILIDTSGSMTESNRMELAKSAVKSVLSTVGQSSFVSVVAFSGSVQLSCFGTKLVPATARNIAKLIEFVDGLSATGTTNFIAAFETAFTILETGAKSCQTSILFLTDGEADDPSSIISERNTNDINAVVFSYTLGSGAAKTVPSKVASMTNGIFTHIEDEDENLITKMSSYYLYYAYGDSNADIIVTSPYLSFATGVAMITMAMPVYVQDTYFVGVVGTDIPLKFLSDAIGEIVIGRKSYSFVVNQESEAILHPLIPDPLTTFFSEGDEYNAVYIQNLEPAEFDHTLLIARTSGSVQIDATVKQPAGDVTYNGYIEETANLLYIYAGVGPSSLSVGIVIYTDKDVTKPNVNGFGLDSSPNTQCDNTTAPTNCIAPFNIFHDLNRILQCEFSWADQASIQNDNGRVVSYKYPAWYLPAGAWVSSIKAVDVNYNASCDEIDELYRATNQIGNSNNDELPFGGIRSEINAKILSSIYTMTSMAEFWKDYYSADNSPIFAFYFATYQGLSIKYPAYRYKRTFNALKRPWYQRAVSYPNSFVFTTPYSDATTNVLVASGATTIIAPNSDYPYGVVGFDFEFDEFLSYWDSVMSDACNKQQQLYCYLIDSSGFLIWYEGIEHDKTDSDISIKFFGDFEPTLFQSLIDKEFFTSEENTNYLAETIDVSWMANSGVIVSGNLDTTETTFVENAGTYTVHRVSGTNLFVIYIINYDKYTYPSNCPATNCVDVTPPGCIKSGNTDSCKSAITDVCTEPDEPTISEGATTCPEKIDTFGVCVLKTGSNPDMCAANFNVDDCADESVSVSVLCSYLVMLCFVFITFQPF